MRTHHELLQDTVEKDRGVMRTANVRTPFVSRGKLNFRSRFLRYVIADHRVERVEVGNLAKVDLLYYPHALKRRGLFEIGDMKMAVHSFDLGEVVTVFQMSPAKGLMIEGPASVVGIVDGVDEYYEVQFRSDVAEYDNLDDVPTYERFIDREGQEDPEAYRRAYNRKIGKAA